MDYQALYKKVSQASILIPIIAGLIHYKNLNKPFKRLVWFFMFCAFIEIGASTLVQIFHNSMPLLHFFTLVEFCMFTYMYVYFYTIKTKYYYITIAVFFLIALMDALFINTIYKFNSLTRSIESITLVLAALFFYYSNIKSKHPVSIYTQPMYWFSTATMVYFSVNFFMFMMMSFFQSNNSPIGSIANNVHGAVNILSNILFVFSFVSFKWKT